MDGATTIEHEYVKWTLKFVFFFFKKGKKLKGSREIAVYMGVLRGEVE